MKTLTAFGLSLSLLAGLTVLATPAPAKEKPTPALQVLVDVPPTWDPFLEDDVAEAFYIQINDTFRRAGIKGDIVQVERHDKIRADVPLLDIRLMEWRISRSGHVDCTFNAGLKRDGTEHNLGLFNGTALHWVNTRDQRWALQRGLEDSAQSAIKDLWSKIQDKNLLPAEAEK